MTAIKIHEALYGKTKGGEMKINYRVEFENRSNNRTDFYMVEADSISDAMQKVIVHTNGDGRIQSISETSTIILR